MTDDAVQGPTDGPSQDWMKLLRDLLGDKADEALESMRAAGFDFNQLSELAEGQPGQIQAAFDQVRRLFTATGSEDVDWQIAEELARQTALQGGDVSLGESAQRTVAEALSVAELWLDAQTTFPPGTAQSVAWSRSEWVHQTLPIWKQFSEPIASSIADAMATAMAANLPEDGGPFGTQGDTIMRKLGGAVFSMQVGQAVGTLAREVFGGTDVSIPVVREPINALVPMNVDAFASELDVPMEETRIFLALREAAHTRLFTHVPWLRGHLIGLVEAYAREITIDMDRMEDAVRSVDPTNPEELQRAISTGVFTIETTPAQDAVLSRLETALALVEGWVDHVAAAAATDRLPHAAALREMLRRRRAAGGPAEHTLTTLVGLELRPRRARDAAKLWGIIEGVSGQQGREAVWAHPDLLPTAEDLDSPESFFQRQHEAAEADAEVDAALAQILADEDSFGESIGTDSAAATAADSSAPDSDEGKSAAEGQGDAGAGDDGPGDEAPFGGGSQS